MKLMNRDEKMEYINGTEWVKSATNEARRKSWVKYMNGKDYIEVAPGIVVELDRNHVKNEFWYNDETVDPLPNADDAKRKFFIQENMDGFEDCGYASWKAARAGECVYGRSRAYERPFIATVPVKNGTPQHYLVCWDHWGWGMKHWEDNNASIYYLSDVELAELDAIMDTLRAKFRKRLETYYKRYSHKICSRGYWADR